MTNMISITLWRSYKNLLRRMMTSFLTCSHQHHKSGTTSYKTLLTVQCDEEMMSTTFPNLIAYATNLEAELECTICNIQLLGEIDTPHWYSTTQSYEVQSLVAEISCFAFYILFCKGLEMMRSDKIHTASHTYVTPWKCGPRDSIWGRYKWTFWCIHPRHIGIIGKLGGV